ncbi:MAG: HAMP domain-containing histidine kinase [Desulfobacterales bacterium]|nr:HAMP domain-containing histidine kinase [Desulfobacterales bacterium]
MRAKLDIIGETGLQFYGKISASISHEIKNVLAIINENAGLLEDFTLMADQGHPIDPARLKMMAKAVKKQIERADGIIGNMNRFAHSIDQTITTVDLAQTMELLIALTARFAAMRAVKVDLQLPQNPVTFQTTPFFLMNLLWLCLDFSMSASGDAKRIELVVEETENSVRIRFKRLAGVTEALLEAFPSDREKNLLAVLVAALTVEPERKEVVLRLSKNIDNELNR